MSYSVIALRKSCGLGRAIALVSFALCAASCAPRAGREPVSKSIAPLELLLRIPGDAPKGELGFRFGPPRDVDGDGIAEIAAGARFTKLELPGMGTATIWSTDSGRELAQWEGHIPDALFGHCVLLHPDIDGDGLADIVASAPSGKYYDVPRGAVFARSPRTKRLIWACLGEPLEGVGWQLDLAGDQDRDGVDDILASAPGGLSGNVQLLSGRTGSVIHTYASKLENDQFGWYVAATTDMDGDGLKDLLVGAPSTPNGTAEFAGAVRILSSATGNEIRIWRGDVQHGQFGDILAAVGDLDGDGKSEVAIGAPFRPTSKDEKPLPGEVFVFSGATGDRLRHWTGTQAGELYGRMVASAGDADGDGIPDIAIGAPWHASAAGEKAGRFELRSGRTGEVIAAVEGDRANAWLGWHIAAGENLGKARRRGLIVSALWSEENGKASAGALLIYGYRGR